jgi:nucleotide-binding universal stress UspA family protein
MRILLPVDGSDASMRAVELVVKEAAQSKAPPQIHLLNVQAALRQGVSAFVGKEQIEGYHREEGTRALAKARARLDAARIPYEHHIGVGEETAEVIARYAREKHCERVVMGTRGLGAVTGVILGSVAMRAIHLVEVPILLVR